MGAPPRCQGAPDQLPNFYHAVTFSIGLNVTTTNKKVHRKRKKRKKCTSRENPGYAYEKRTPPYVGMGPPVLVALPYTVNKILALCVTCNSLYYGY